MKKPWSSVSAIPEFDHDGSHSPMRSKSNGTPVQDRAFGPFPLLQNGSVDSAALNDSINEAQTGDTTMSTDVPDDMTRETPAPTIETHPSSTGSPNVLHRRIQVAQESSVAGNSFANDNGIGHTSQASHKRNAPSRNVRISTFSAETSGGSRDKTSGRRSTLREALGKLFGRRKKTSIGRSSSGPDSVRETPDTTEQQNSVRHASSLYLDQFMLMVSRVPRLKPQKVKGILMRISARRLFRRMNTGEYGGHTRLGPTATLLEWGIGVPYRLDPTSPDDNLESTHFCDILEDLLSSPLACHLVLRASMGGSKSRSHSMRQRRRSARPLLPKTSPHQEIRDALGVSPR